MQAKLIKHCTLIRLRLVECGIDHGRRDLMRSAVGEVIVWHLVFIVERRQSVSLRHYDQIHANNRLLVLLRPIVSRL